MCTQVHKADFLKIISLYLDVTNSFIHDNDSNFVKAFSHWTGPLIQIPSSIWEKTHSMTSD